MDKSFTAADGSVYRVEPDGSFTKISDGINHSEEDTSKYHITHEGNIYHEEPDGSVTYLGNVDGQLITPSQTVNNSTKKKNNKWVWFTICICFLLIMGLIVFLSDKFELLQQNKFINDLFGENRWFNYRTTNDKDEKTFFHEVTMFRGGNKQDDESGFCEMIFYPNGVCVEYTLDSEGSMFSVPTYYMMEDKLYLNYGDSRNIMIDMQGDSFKYGYLFMKKTPINHQTYFFDNPMKFENYSDYGVKKTAKYYPDGSCTITDSESNIKTNGTYSIKEGIINIKWEDGASEEYYYNSYTYGRDEVFFWGHSFTQDDYDDEYIQKNGYFPGNTKFYGENESNRLSVIYSPDGKCSLDGYILEEGDWIYGSSEGKYHIKNDIIYVIWDDWINESYKLEDSQYTNEGVIFIRQR